LRLTTNSKLSTCSTGKSAGCAPRRILAMKDATRRRGGLASAVI
jgi:hydrogenase maturation factor